MVMLSLKRAVENYRLLREIRSDDWRENWFPILGDDPGNLWGVECAKKPTADGPVVIFMHQLPGNGIAFDSVERMLSTMVAAFEAGIISDRGDGFLETDYAKLRPLMQSMNPGASVLDQESP